MSARKATRSTTRTWSTTSEPGSPAARRASSRSDGEAVIPEAAAGGYPGSNKRRCRKKKPLPLPSLRHRLDCLGVELVDVVDQVVGHEVSGVRLFLQHAVLDQEVH